LRRWRPLIVAAIGCSRPPGAAAPAPDASAAASAPAAPAASRRPLPPLPDGCWNGAADAGAAALLADLGERCAPGLAARLAAPLVVRLGEGASHELSLEIADPSKCLRGIAAGGEGIVELELILSDARGAELAADDLRGPIALLLPRGPVCLREGGAHRVTLRAAAGAGEVALQIWAAP
jgi:hypothetical protein